MAEPHDRDLAMRGSTPSSPRSYPTTCVQQRDTNRPCNIQKKGRLLSHPILRLCESFISGEDLSPRLTKLQARMVEHEPQQGSQSLQQQDRLNQA